jgi:DNA repair photolyase
MSNHGRSQTLKGRGASLSPNNRFRDTIREAFDDGWQDETPLRPLQTTLARDNSQTVITYNKSPDVPFDRSINPYRGCEHGCVYCFARPTHAWLDLSPGLDFETRLFYKPDAPSILRKELARKRYRCAPIALGINTDAYQPVEREQQLTRRIIEVLLEARHPFSIVTKSALIERDLDLLQTAAQQKLASVAVSITTLNKKLARYMEPRAASPERRLETIQQLAAAGIPVAVLVAPVIPALTDHEMENILTRSREAGADAAGYVLLRLPHELKEMFRNWLNHHEPLKAARVMNRLRDCREGSDYQSQFGSRMRGTGVFAQLLENRFNIYAQRLGYGNMPELDCSQFRPPRLDDQLALFSDL